MTLNFAKAIELEALTADDSTCAAEPLFTPVLKHLPTDETDDHTTSWGPDP
jgi:hypothetical protein